MENSREIQRVVFFSKQDLSIRYNLQNAEQILKSTDFSKITDINDYLEYYNIKLYFENKLFLLSWSDDIKNDFQLKVEEAWKNIVLLFNSFQDLNILKEVSALEHSYRKSFWELYNNLSIYKKISKQVFSEILKNNQYHIRIILTYQKIVNQYSNEVAGFLKYFHESAELLLSNFEQYHASDIPKYYFPKNLSIQDRQKIISEYIDRDDANLNYVRLVENSKSPELKLSDKLKLKAKRRSKELNDKLLSEGYSVKFGAQVSISENQEEPVVYANHDNILSVTYSKKTLESLRSEVELFRVFDMLFSYTDNRGLITLVSTQNEMGNMEKLFMKSKNEYNSGIAFQQKSNLSHLQLMMFHHYLIHRETTLEKVLESFIQEAINKLFNLKILQFNFPSINSSFLEKIRVIAPEFEFLLKQFKVYVEDGKIDFELLNMSSTPLNLSEIPSLNDKKYIYSSDRIIDNLIHHFLSDQSSIYYTETFNTIYHNFYDLVKNENVTLGLFKDYQKEIINHLIDEGYLSINKNGRINFKNPIFIHVIKELHENEVINYWHFPEIVRTEIDKMLESKLLFSENKLFSKPEIDYLNFHLNKKQFTNGLDLRNKYLHGTNTSSEEEHEQEYHILLKILILTLLKIENDLAICRQNQS